jgi:glycerol transport system ATP-binding protein
MNIIPTELDGASVRLGEYFAPLPAKPHLRGTPRLEIGVRPEYVRVGVEGIPAKVVRVEDAGRFRILHATVEGQGITAILRESEEIPADLHITIDPKGLNLYADSWRVELGGSQSGEASQGEASS